MDDRGTDARPVHPLPPASGTSGVPEPPWSPVPSPVTQEGTASHPRCVRARGRRELGRRPQRMVVTTVAGAALSLGPASLSQAVRHQPSGSSPGLRGGGREPRPRPALGSAGVKHAACRAGAGARRTPGGPHTLGPTSTQTLPSLTCPPRPPASPHLPSSRSLQLGRHLPPVSLCPGNGL